MSVARWTRDYVGIPYRDLGRDRSGCDCWGLARLVWTERAGVEVPMYGTVHGGGGAGGEVEPAVLEATSGDLWNPVQWGDERGFDAVLMRGVWRDAGGALHAGLIHVGIVAAPGVMLHIEQGIDASLGFYRSDPRLSRRVDSFWRHRELS